jgi:hypothetical protein
MKITHCLGLAAAVAVASPAAADPEALAALFPMRAEITSTGAGLCRLELPAGVIGRCRADLADLRILASDGREIPYVVDSPEPAGAATEVRYAGSPEILAAERSREAIDERVTEYRESYVLGVPVLPADVAAWDLVMEISQAEFVARLDLAAVGPGGEQTPIVTGGSVFRLPAADAEKLRVTIPVRDASRLEVVISSQDQGFLQPRFSVESSRLIPELSVSRLDLETREVRPLANATELVVDRPRGLVPRRIAIATSTGTFHRSVTVWDEGPGADPDPLASGRVLRVAVVAPVEVLEIPLRPPRGDRLRIVIDNQDSPPLEDVSFAALMPRPVLVFPMPEGTLTGTLYFGGGRAHRPHYDLAALDPDQTVPAAGEAARQALALLDPARAHRATLGRVEPNPEYDPSPALAFAMHPGAPIDPGLYSHRRRLEVVPSAEGLARLGLEPEDLAAMRTDQADLRIVDGDGRQWAYLRQDRARRVFLPLEVAGHRRVDRVSHYRLEVGEGPLVLDRIDVESDAPYFDRDFTLRGRLDDGSDQELTRGRLIRRAGDPRPTAITFEPTRLDRFELEVEDGDDAPLTLRRIGGRSSAPDVYIAAAAGPYELLLGYPDAEAPVYELERVRSTVLAVPASDVVTGELEANPAFSSARRLSGAGAVRKLLLWGVLGLAVVVLLIVTLRAARQEAGTGSG